MNVEKQVAYWKSGAEEDFAAARSLLEAGHWRHALFFAHLALGKGLKALVTRRTRRVPPRTHNLMRLAELAALALSEERKAFLRGFDAYAFAARYPGAEALPLAEQTARDRFTRAEEMLAWLTKQS